MKTDTRTHNAIRNIIFSLIGYLIQTILSFITRRYFIYVFSVEYLGLNSLFSNVLSVLSLAELGFGSALVFAMYKPMAENDEEKVRQLLHFYKINYRIIGAVVAVLGLAVFPFMGHFAAKAPNVNVNLNVVYALFLINSVSSYFFAYRKSLLYTSQRNDIESKVNIIVNIISTSVTFVVLLVFKNYYAFVSISILSNFLSNISIYIITNKKYANLVKNAESPLDKESKKAINKNIFALMFHKIGSVVVYSTDSLIIFLMIDSATLGKYSNYLLITTAITAIITLFNNSVRGGIGNSIASEDAPKNNKLLNKFNFLYFWIVSFCTICIFTLSDSFIKIALTKTQEDLTLGTAVVLLICLSFYLNTSRYLLGTFKECAGLFYQDRIKPIIESVVNLVVSIILAKFIGLPGVIIGTIVSTIVCPLWVEPYVLNKYYLKQSTWKYFGKYSIYTIAMILSGAGTWFICSFIHDLNIWTLVAKFAVCAVLPNLLLLLCLFWMPEFKECIAWGKELLINFKNSRNEKKKALTMIEDQLQNGAEVEEIKETINKIASEEACQDEGKFASKQQITENDNENN